MKNFSWKRPAILLLLSLVLSLGIVRWHSVTNVPFCLYSAGCNDSATPRGTIKTHDQGFPLTYYKSQTFRPDNGNEKSPDYAGFAEAKVVNLALSIPSIVANVVFWYCLLQTLANLLLRRKRSEPIQPAATTEV